MAVVPGANMRYLTGTESLMLERPFMLLVPVQGEAQLVAPALESGPFREVPLPIRIHTWTDSEGPGDSISAVVRESGMKGAWGIEGKAPFLYVERLMQASHAKFRNAEPVLQGLREVKDEEEVRLLKRSAEILSRAFEGFPALIEEGRSEIELAKAMADVIYSCGATRVDEVLVQTGSMAADPHHLPSTRKVRRGESIVVDAGSTLEGYYADITRTFCLGRPPEVERVYERVLEAQLSAIEQSTEGTRVGAVDSAARGVLAAAGLGKYFFHRTGHGLGLEIHESPYITEGGEEKLSRNMCFTVEPGAYIAGKLGVRIEDDVIVEGGRGEPTTNTPKVFGWWY